jgi:hypothetical protein
MPRFWKEQQISKNLHKLTEMSEILWQINPKVTTKVTGESKKMIHESPMGKRMMSPLEEDTFLENSYSSWEQGSVMNPPCNFANMHSSIQRRRSPQPLTRHRYLAHRDRYHAIAILPIAILPIAVAISPLLS